MQSNLPMLARRGGLDRAALLAALRARAAGATPGGGGVALPPGLPRLPGAVLHELRGESEGLAAVLMGRAGGLGVWIAGAAGPWPVLAPHGLAPAQLLLARAVGADATWAAEEALRCPGVGAVVLAGGEAPAADALRRLAAAAAQGGGLGLVVRPADAPELEVPAASCWTVEGIGAAGRFADPRWEVSLRRGRGGRPSGPWTLAWRAGEGALVLDAEGLREAG